MPTNEYQSLGVQSPQRMVNDLLKRGGFTQQKLANEIRLSQSVISRLRRYDHEGNIPYLHGKRLEKLWRSLMVGPELEKKLGA